MASSVSPSAAKRLARDLVQLSREALPTVAAAPATDQDLSVWNFSLTSAEGPYMGCIFHGVLTFPFDYPVNPPTVKLCTGLPHPNIFDGYDYNRHKSDEGHFICLNMLRPPGDANVEAYSGWSSAYSVHALLMQLSSFLFAENVPQDYGGSIRNREDDRSVKRGKEHADAFHAARGSEFPPLPLAAALQRELQDEEQRIKTEERRVVLTSLSNLSLGPTSGSGFTCTNKGTGLQRCSSSVCLCAALGLVKPTNCDGCATTKQPAAAVPRPKNPNTNTDEQNLSHDPFDALPEDVVLHILSQLEPEDLASVRSTDRTICVVMYRYNVWERREVICFHTKLSFEEEVLGVGCEIEYHGRSQDIKAVKPQLDLLSKSAFDAGVRRGVWGEQFDRWLPLWLCEAHGERAWPQIVATVHGLACATSSRRAPSRGQSHLPAAVAEQYLHFFGKCMNSFAVCMMRWEDKQRDGGGDDARGDDGAPAPTSTTRASERALSGYCAYHHLLLVYCSKFPAMRQAADALVDAMLAGHGDKSKVPDLGILLACLTVSSRSWADPAVAWEIVGESLDRNVRWLLQKKQMPTLRDLEKPAQSRAGHEDPTVQLPGGYEAGNAGERAFLADWWRHSLTSKRVLMFQAYFITSVGRPRGAHPTTILQHYNRSLGRASPRMVARLQQACAEIYTVQSWQEFFSRLGLPCPHRVQVLRRLRNAVQNSRRKGYHGLLPGQTQLGAMEQFERLAAARRAGRVIQEPTRPRGRRPTRLLAEQGSTLRQLGLRR